MKQKFTSPLGNTISIDASAVLLIDNANHSTPQFAKGLKDVIHIPSGRATNGFIKLTVSVEIDLPKNPLNIPNLSASRTAQWTFSKDGAGKVEFQSSSVTPKGDFESMPLDIVCSFTPSSDAASASVSLLISTSWGGGIGVASESMDRTLTLTDVGTKATVAPRLWPPAFVRFGPFVTNQRDRLEKGDLNLEVRNWFRKLHPITQDMMTRASTPDQMPLGQSVHITGYASTLGSEAHNYKLAWHRAQAVRLAIIMASRNSTESVYLTGSEGEGVATDKRSEENDDPVNRRVDVFYLDTFDY